MTSLLAPPMASNTKLLSIKNLQMPEYVYNTIEYPQQYKDGTINAMVHRTNKISSDWASFLDSIVKLKQAFSNNGYPNRLFDSILSKYMSKRNITAMHSHDTTNSHNSEPTPHMHKINYKNQFSKAYKTDERTLLQIIKNNTNCQKHEEQLKILIYYKSINIYSLLTNNNHSKKIDPLKTTNAIYKFKCTTMVIACTRIPLTLT